MHSSIAALSCSSLNKRVQLLGVSIVWRGAAHHILACLYGSRSVCCTASAGLFLAEIRVGIVVVECIVHLTAARNLIIGLQWVRLSGRNHTFAEGTWLRAKHILVACHIAGLVFAIVESERAQPFRVSLCTTHIFCV